MTASATEGLAASIRALGELSVPDLRRRFEQVCARPTRSDNREHLTRTIAQTLCDADPPSDRNARRRVARALEAALRPRKGPEARSADPRIPPAGSILRRRYRGREIQVRISRRGFVYEGQTYSSLTAVAHAVTGAHWNGLIFFGLTERKRGPAGRRQS